MPRVGRAQAPRPAPRTLAVSSPGLLWLIDVVDVRLTADPAPGFTETGVFSAETPVVEYFYDGVAGDLLIVELRAPGFEPTDPLLNVYGPDGSLVASDDDGGGYPNSRIVLDIPTTGEYVIQATTFGDFHGPFTIEASFLGAGQSYAADRDMTRVP